MTEPRSPAEERLQRAEPEKDVAAGTRALVLGPYLVRRRVRRGGPAHGPSNPRSEAARLDEAVGLAQAIDLNVLAA
ncbi:MAG TPA: GTPase HflX, partial [Beijerinckiaceae bacterium]|nr:GTPase HflX [Beijerinckiaceae bacterium]